MENDLFISCHPEDLLVAGQIQTALVGVGVRCFIPNRAGQDSSINEAVHQALDASRIFLLVHSSAANQYDPVTREARRAVGRNARVVLFRLEDVPLSEHLTDVLGQPSGVEAFPPPIEPHISYLVEAVQLLLRANLDQRGSRALAVTEEVPGLAPTKVPLGDEPASPHETLPTATSAPDVQRHTPQALSSFTDGLNPLRKTQTIDPPTRLGIIGHIDRYEILRKIGEGGMGVVLLATDTKTGQQVAVKTVKPEYVGNPRAQHRFATEAKHMQRMNHPHVLRVMEVCERPNGTYYVMPFISAGSLAEKITPGTPLEPRLVLKIGRQIADALRYAHDEAGVIHRDIKPENVLLDASENAYLSDFGLVRTVFNDTLPDNHQVSWTVGTRPYMAPEIVAGKAGDTRADIYSFGAMLYEMATGRPPYLGESAEEVMTKIKLGPPPKVLEVNPHCPPELASVIEAAMGRELRDRYAHMADVLADLERAEHGIKPLGAHDAPAPSEPSVGMSALPERFNPRKARSRNTSAAKWAAVLAVLLLGLGGAYVLIAQSRDTTVVKVPPTTSRDADRGTLEPLQPPRPKPEGTTAVDLKDVQQAIAQNDLPGLETLMKTHDISDIAKPVAGSPIREAISQGKEEIALKLLAMIDSKELIIEDQNGATLMELAAEHGAVRIIHELHSRGVAVDAPNRLTQLTPLHHAVMQHQVDAVRELVISGANPDLRSPKESPREKASTQPAAIKAQLMDALNASASGR
jgi:serine/threonine protein kinase